MENLHEDQSVADVGFGFPRLMFKFVVVEAFPFDKVLKVSV